MSKNINEIDFERSWQEKLAKAIEKSTDQETRERVMEGGKALNQASSSEEKIRWTCQALGRLAETAVSETRQEILTQCACQYPVEDLKEIKMNYQVKGDLDIVIDLLQEKFEGFLRESLGLDEELISVIRSKGWGLAGVLDAERKRVVATKIPKSGYIQDYFNESDLEEKRRYYCHCPRARDGIGKEPRLQEEYCYCGAGFYKGIWEEILGKPVRVEMLESVMSGDDVCKVAVYLPE
jgi:hypothetical protein